MIEEKKIYSTKELSKILGITERTVRQYIAEGIIRGGKIGSRLFVTEDSLNKTIKKLEEKP